MTSDTRPFHIAGQPIDTTAPPFVIAEIGLNHGGSPERALALVDAAAVAGASAVKLQTLDAALLVAPDAPAPAHVSAASMVEFFRAFELDEAAHRLVIARARARGLAVLATPFSEPAVAMLGRLGVDAFKIASGDVTCARLIRACGATGRPLVLSTGMSTLDEVARARRWALDAGAGGVALLHCVSSYPVAPGTENLRGIATLAETFGGAVGLSDHAPDASALPLVVALGASLYERHLMLAAGDGAIDAAVSSTPGDLARAIQEARRAWMALGTGTRRMNDIECRNRVPSRRALYARCALPAGHALAADDIVALRPAIGWPAEDEELLIGRVLARPVNAGLAFTAAALVPLEAPRVA